MLTDGVARPSAAELRALDRELGEVLRLLARAIGDRPDRAALDVVTICAVRPPAAAGVDCPPKPPLAALRDRTAPRRSRWTP